MALAQSHRNIISTSVPNVSDCGLFGTDCDGNSYLQVSEELLRVDAG